VLRRQPAGAAPALELPASWLQGHPGLRVVVDAAAASALPLG
jgi:6-phosphogluconolactonase/glucosamine-6-phosphate isomerase/deaminase